MDGDRTTPHEPEAATDHLTALGALAEPSRRALYEYVTAQSGWVGREQAAGALGLRRGIVAHHLDRLVDDGLLEVGHQRLSGREGPGAGRPAKVYRRAPAEVAVSLPPRLYDLAGHLLAEAADRSRLEGEPIEEALAAVAGQAGREMAAEAKAAASAGEGRRAVLVDALRRKGFEPEELPDGSTVLRNCPFHQLAQRHTELVCTMNLCLLDGLVDGLGDAGVSAELAPSPDHCCVRFRPEA